MSAAPQCLKCGSYGQGACPYCGSARDYVPGEPNPRTWMGRFLYHYERRQAFRVEREACLLDGYARDHGGPDGTRRHALSAHMRKTIAAPADPVERARNARWANLQHRLRGYHAERARQHMKHARAA